MSFVAGASPRARARAPQHKGFLTLIEFYYCMRLVGLLQSGASREAAVAALKQSATKNFPIPRLCGCGRVSFFCRRLRSRLLSGACWRSAIAIDVPPQLVCFCCFVVGAGVGVLVANEEMIGNAKRAALGEDPVGAREAGAVARVGAARRAGRPRCRDAGALRSDDRNSISEICT